MFSMALGHQAHEEDEVELNFSFRQEEREVHTLNGIKKTTSTVSSNSCKRAMSPYLRGTSSPYMTHATQK